MLIEVNPARVLLVDDDQYFIERATRALEPLGTVRVAQSARKALAVAGNWYPDVILLDLLLDDLDGFTFLEVLTASGLSRLPFILCTTEGRGADTRVRPLPDWSVGTLVRSSSIQQLRSAVRQAVHCQDPNRQRWMTA